MHAVPPSFSSASRDGLLMRWVGAWICLSVLSAPAAADMSARQVIDPWDYNYCGGEPVYPVIGINFSTFCGPRNQVALGRRGTLMWIFPAVDGERAHAQGRRKLSEAELKRLSLLAEVAQLADPPYGDAGGVNYRLGIDFQGRPYKRMHAIVSERYTPANELFRAMLELVPDTPLMPACERTATYYDPTTLPADRQALTEQPRLGFAYDRKSR